MKSCLKQTPTKTKNWDLGSKVSLHISAATDQMGASDMAVCLSICLSTHLTIYPPSILPSIFYPPTPLYTSLSLSIHSSSCLFVYLPVYLSSFLLIHPLPMCSSAETNTEHPVVSTQSLPHGRCSLMTSTCSNALKFL